MIKSVVITNHNEESVEIELANPNPQVGLIVTSIDGLGPPQASINTIDVAFDGSLFSSARLQARNIVFNFRLFEAPSIEEVRTRVYRYFPVKKRVQIEVKSDVKSVYAYGYVEHTEPDIFSSEESMQVSVVCPDPYFYDLAGSITLFAGTHPLFEFPWSNESLTEKLIEFGMMYENSEALIQYNGDIDTGLVIYIHATGTPGNITIYDRTTQEIMEIDVERVATISGVAFGEGDDIIVSTVRGDKYCRLLHEGEYYNIIGAIKKGSKWFSLTAGVNSFAFSAESGEVSLSTTFTYRNAYGGI